MNKRILIVVDAQGDFCNPDGALYVPGAELVVGKINRLLRNLDRNEYSHVLFTFDTHQAEGWADTEEGKMFPIHCVQNTEGWMLVIEPEQVPFDITKVVLYKGVFDMWASPTVVIQPYVGSSSDMTLIGDFFGRIVAPGVTGVDVCGVATDYCVNDAVRGLLRKGFKVRVFSDLVKGINREVDEVNEQDWAPLGVVELIDSNAVRQKDSEDVESNVQ
jgi:nicotinamidase/pyrazinamidase